MLRHALSYAAIFLIIITAILIPARNNTLQVEYLVYLTTDYDTRISRLWRVSYFTDPEWLLEFEGIRLFFHLKDDFVFLTLLDELAHETSVDLRDLTVKTLFTSVDYIGVLVTVSPDGQWLYYAWEGDLFRVHIDGTRGELIIAHDQYTSFEWHDNTLIFLATRDNNHFDLYFHDINTPYAQLMATNVHYRATLGDAGVLYPVEVTDRKGVVSYTIYLQPYDGSPRRQVTQLMGQNGIWFSDGHRFYNSQFGVLTFYEPRDWRPKHLNLPAFGHLYQAEPEILYYYNTTSRIDFYSSDPDGQNVRLVFKGVSFTPSRVDVIVNDEWIAYVVRQLYLAHKSGHGHHVPFDDGIIDASWTNIDAPVPDSQPYRLLVTGCGMLLVALIWRRIMV